MKFRNHPEILRSLFMVIIALVIILTLMSLYSSYSIIHLTRRPVTVDPSYYGLEYENAVFNSLDGLRLKGWLIPKNGSKSLIIICHGHTSNKGEMIGFADLLHRSGYSIFLFDFRAHGESEGNFASLGWLEPNDLMGAIEYVKERVKPDNIGILGFSMGGATAITTAGQTSDIKAVVADSAFADRSRLIAKAALFDYLTLLFVQMQGLNLNENLPLNYAEKISPNALLIMQGDKDHLVDVEDAELLYNKAKEPKEFWLVSNAPHVGIYQTERAEYERRVVGFFDKYLK